MSHHLNLIGKWIYILRRFKRLSEKTLHTWWCLSISKNGSIEACQSRLHNGLCHFKVYVCIVVIRAIDSIWNMIILYFINLLPVCKAIYTNYTWGKTFKSQYLTKSKLTKFIWNTQSLPCHWVNLGEGVVCTRLPLDGWCVRHLSCNEWSHSHSHKNVVWHGDCNNAILVNT